MVNAKPPIISFKAYSIRPRKTSFRVPDLNQEARHSCLIRAAWAFLRNSGRVLLAPCDLMGKMLGPQIEAFAYELPVAQHRHANALLAKKYGEKYEMDPSSEGEGADEETFMEIISTEHFPSEAVKRENHE